MDAVDLGQISKSLEHRVSQLSFRGKSALFGVCGYAFLPVLRQVEERFMRRWTFPDAESALHVSREFAVGVASARDNHELRNRILEAVPNGHELDSPWSTYAIDASICIDAALVAASADLHASFKPSWIYYALEPLAEALSPIGYELDPVLFSTGGRLYEAVSFLGNAISELSAIDDISDEVYEGLLREAVVISPLSEV